MNKRWQENFGQAEAFAILNNITSSNRIPHAFLFVGQEGIGKHLSAINLAHKLNSLEDEKRNTILKEKIFSLSEPYIKYIFPLPRGKNETGDDTAYSKLSSDVIEQIQSELKIKAANPYYNFKINSANNIKISSIREIRKFISFNFQDVKYRFVFIQDAHLMNEESQNALLKSLEEPPEGIIFVLMTPFADKLLPTIISRCWRINFKPLKRNIVEDILVGNFNIESELAKKVSYFADGSVSEGYKLCQKNFDEIVENAINLLRYSIAGRYNTAFQLLNEFIEDSPKESLKLLVSLIQRWLSDTVKNRNDLSDYYFGEYSDTLEKFNEKFNPGDVLTVFRNLENQIEAIDRNLSLNIITMNIIFEIASIAVRK